MSLSQLTADTLPFYLRALHERENEREGKKKGKSDKNGDVTWWSKQASRQKHAESTTYFRCVFVWIERVTRRKEGKERVTGRHEIEQERVRERKNEERREASKET